MITLQVRKERVGPVLGRHPWVFSGALQSLPDEIPAGTPVKLTDPSGKFLAQGYFNSYSQIAVRVWSYDENEKIDEKFFIKRIERAESIRKKYVANTKTDSYRLINAENDFLPGLIVDKYADYLVIQCHTSGIEAWKKEIISALAKTLKPKGIYEKSDSSSRKVEKLDEQTGLLFGKMPELITIKENGFKFLVDIARGQKTGFFLDQRDKRQALVKYAKGKTVLNGFSYTGGFSVYALSGGAKKVVSVDSSADALELAKENIKLNKLAGENCEFVCQDAKQYLRSAPANKFDLIVLDPPAFIKDRKKKEEGIIGYKNINEAAFKILPESGILATCSCSAHLSLQEFRYLLSSSAGRAKKSAQILESYTHGIDHLGILPFTEGEYLKCLFIGI